MAKSQITFEPAKKEATYLRMALMGPSGSGKTYTALTLATKLAQLSDSRIAVICTEGRAARKLADIFDFDVFDMPGQYDPAIYCDAIEAAADQGYKVLIVDSFSHAWNGAGGILEIVDRAGTKMGGNKFAGWSKGRPAQNRLVNTILNTPIHIIGTLRSKTDWVLDDKNKPQKVGLSAVQDGDFEYELDLVGSIDMNHTMTITKSRCHHIAINSEHTDTDHLAQTLHAWLTDGVELPAPRIMTAGETYLRDEAGRARLSKLFNDLGITNGTAKDFKPYLGKLGINTFSDFTGAEDELHTSIIKIHGQLNQPSKMTTLDDLRKKCHENIAPDITDAEIARLAGTGSILMMAGLDLDLQFDIILSAFETEMASAIPATPKNVSKLPKGKSVKEIDAPKDGNKDQLPDTGNKIDNADGTKPPKA